MKKLFAELRRRHVFRVAGIYALVSWLLAQAAVLVEAPLSLPPWFDTLVLILLLLGFPLAMVLGWAFDLTPDGVKRTEPLPATHPGADASQLSPSDAFKEKPGAGAVDDAAIATASAPSKHAIIRPGIAVLPFANMSTDPEIEHLADGLTEDLITMLSANRHLSVAARTSSFAYKGQPVDIRAVGEALGALYVVEGSLRKTGQDVRVTVQFIEAQSGSHIWARKFDEPLAALYGSSDDLIERIAGALFAQLIWAEAERAEHAPPASLGAWEYCQRVSTRISHAAGSVKTQRFTITEIEKALAIEPDSGIAHALASWVYNAAILNGTCEDDEQASYVARAKQHLKRARELAQDDLLCLTYIGGAENFAGMQERALHTLQHVIARNPASADAWYILCQVYAYLGRHDEAIAAIDRASELAPEAGFAPMHGWYRGLALFLAGDYQTARPLLAQKVLETPEYGYANILCAISEDTFGNNDAASKYIARAKEHNPQLRPHKVAGMLLTQADKDKGAREYATLERLWNAPVTVLA